MWVKRSSFFWVAMVVFSAACTERETRWDLSYAPESLALEVSELRAEIRQGSCDGPAIFSSDLPAANEFPVLEPGRYGFFARASDGNCQWFASGCLDRDLPLGDGEGITLVLSPETRSERCAGACRGGTCARATDGGVDTDANVGGLLAIEVSTGRAHSCARVRDADAVYCWGLNESLQLGAVTGAVEQLTPVRVDGLVGPVALATGGNGQPKDGHSCAVIAGGEVRCWGDNLLGQLGTSTAGAPRSTPQTVVGLMNARGIDAGRQHTCAITTDSDVFCWGANESGQVGIDAATAAVATPNRVSGLGGLMQVATGEAHSCATSGSGAVRCWGDNGSDQLGNASAGSSSSTPVQVQDLNGVASIALGNEFSCALRMSGEVLCWGRNADGVLGDPGFPSGPTPQRVALPDRPVAELACGSDFACARMVDGDVQCWGSNSWGALGRGEGTPGSAMTPGPVVGIDNATDISASDNHVCAVTADGRVLCWGRGQQGRLGNGVDTLDRSTPTGVAGFGP